MTSNATNKGINATKGIHALAYSTSDFTSPLSCSLFFTCSKGSGSIIVSVRCVIPIDGFVEAQPFTLLYPADDLVSGKTSLTCPDTLPPKEQLEMIPPRLATPDLRTLSLTVRKPCSFSCPLTPGKIRHKHGFKAVFDQLKELAKATNIYILFDYNWLQQHQDFVRCLNKLTASSLKRQTIENYTIFSTSDDDDDEEDKVVVSDNPPPYSETKRPKRSKDTDLPPAKRVPPSSPQAATASTPSFQEAIKTAVEKLLPETLKEILPDLLLCLFPAPTLLPSSSSSTLQPSLSSLNTLISASIAELVVDQLNEVYTKALEDAEATREIADSEFEEVCNDRQRQLCDVADVAIYDVEHITEEKLQLFQESVAETVEEAKEQMDENAEKFYDEFHESLQGLIKETMERFKKWQGTRQNATEDQNRRARSMPVTSSLVR